jgi:hypothetical protein
MAHVKGQAKEKELATSVTSVYLHVVEDVIQSVRDDFQSEGVDESVLVELRQVSPSGLLTTSCRTSSDLFRWKFTHVCVGFVFHVLFLGLIVFS